MRRHLHVAGQCPVCDATCLNCERKNCDNRFLCWWRGVQLTRKFKLDSTTRYYLRITPLEQIYTDPSNDRLVATYLKHIGKYNW